MPRRQFVADLKKAQDDVLPAGVLDIRAGEDDGQFEFEFAAPTLDGFALVPVTITAMIPDVSDYPKSHEYMIFCGDDAPRHIGQALQDVRSTQRKTVFELVEIVATTLSSLAPDSDGDTHMMDSQPEYDQDEDDEVDEYEYENEADDPFAFGAPKPTPSTVFVPTPSRSDPVKAKDRAFRQRVRSDLRAVKEAGFRVGHLGHLLGGYNAFVTASIRISKLGISEEALQAWGLEPSEYLILIIQYPNGYKTNEELQSYDAIRLKPNIGMRVYAGKRYKPTVQEAIKAFTKAHRDQSHTYPRDKESQEEYHDTSSIRETFISRSTTTLLEDTLVPILRFRSTGMDWNGAESWFQYAQSESTSMLGDPNAVPDKYFTHEEVNTALPEIVRGDQYSQNGVYQHSFPLLAMQFLLRHFVRCTEFCLVCHSKMSTELEAIKPYVCDNPLCLFQYMALGFGPSIEHEIMAQPYVVDLLVSFCYSSAQSRKLKDFPDGLALMVPPVNPDNAAPLAYSNPYAPPVDYSIGKQAQKQPNEPANMATWEVGFDQERLELIFFDKPNDGCPVARGTWIVIKTAANLDDPNDELHCKVTETTFYPTLKVDKPVVVKKSLHSTVTEMSAMPKKEQVITPATTPRYTPTTFTVYDQDFEELDAAGKCAAICKLLDTLPSVKDMQEYLSTRHPADLKSWSQRMSPAATSLLRWIIASNRACIMQVDSGDDSTSNKQERIHGMMGYMQFRFAMGAPDKEQRFLSEVRNTTTRLNLAHPTIFAWHGSPVYNWHMIIREGLHYKNANHGRAYGNGVYHAKEAGTSSGYSGRYGGMVHYGWRNSVLKVSSALALNEIVNATSEFVSHNPYYVVAQLDWIQTRYLFVECQPTDANLIPSEERTIEDAHEQDPARTPRGMSQAIKIPASAIKSGRKVKTAAERQASHSSLLDRPSKKQKGKSGDPIIIPDDCPWPGAAGYESDTDTSDVDILFDEDEPAPDPVPTALTKKPTGPTTDFVPNTLNFATLPMLPLPTYATSSTTKRLMNELRTLSKIQETTPPAELGWHVPVDSIENVYQWIVELHSFHTFTPTLPLATDMTSRGIKSIVLEIRFGSDFPFSPPYIRVIRPRLLLFQQGGGGHVVMGGAMCMELLTADGWSSVLGMEGVLLQVRMAIASEPHARLEGKEGKGRGGGGGGDYGAGEAAEGYMRACRTHGWTVPRGFREVAYGVEESVGDDYVKV